MTELTTVEFIEFWCLVFITIFCGIESSLMLYEFIKKIQIKSKKRSKRKRRKKKRPNRKGGNPRLEAVE